MALYFQCRINKNALLHTGFFFQWIRFNICSIFFYKTMWNCLGFSHYVYRVCIIISCLLTLNWLFIDSNYIKLTLEFCQIGTVSVCSFVLLIALKSPMLQVMCLYVTLVCSLRCHKVSPFSVNRCSWLMLNLYNNGCFWIAIELCHKYFLTDAFIFRQCFCS